MRRGLYLTREFDGGQEMSLSGTPIIVGGMYRSGTSITANALARLGAYMGDESAFFPTDSYNETGYFEHRDITKLNRRILASMSMTYHRLWPVPDDWKEWPRTEGLVKDIDKLFSKLYAGRKLWGWKDPMTSVVMPFYREFLQRRNLRAHHVICVRNPLDVVPSLNDVFTQEPLLGFLPYGLWLHYTLSALRETRSENRTVVLYRDLIEDPRKTLDRIVNSIEGWSPDETAWAEACGSIRPELCHRSSGASDLETYPSILGRTFALCEAAARDTLGLRAGGFDSTLDELWIEFCQLREMTGELSLPYGKLGFRDANSPQAPPSESKYLPTRHWQSLRIPVNFPPGTQCHLAVYQLPSVVWIRNAVWRQGDKEISANLTAGPNGNLETVGQTRRLSVFGMHPDQLSVRTPPGDVSLEFEIEFLIETDYFIAIEIVRLLRAAAQDAKQRIQYLEDHAERMEARVQELTIELRNRSIG